MCRSWRVLAGSDQGLLAPGRLRGERLRSSQNKEMDSALLGLNKRCQDFWVTKHGDEEGSWAAEAAAFCFQSGSNYLNYLNYPNYPYVSPGTGSPARNWDHQNSAGVGRKPNRCSTAMDKKWFPGPPRVPSCRTPCAPLPGSEPPPAGLQRRTQPCVGAVTPGSLPGRETTSRHPRRPQRRVGGWSKAEKGPKTHRDRPPWCSPCPPAPWIIAGLRGRFHGD